MDPDVIPTREARRRLSCVTGRILPRHTFDDLVERLQIEPAGRIATTRMWHASDIERLKRAPEDAHDAAIEKAFGS